RKRIKTHHRPRHHKNTSPHPDIKTPRTFSVRSTTKHDPHTRGYVCARLNVGEGPWRDLSRRSRRSRRRAGTTIATSESCNAKTPKNKDCCEHRSTRWEKARPPDTLIHPLARAAALAAAAFGNGLIPSPVRYVLCPAIMYPPCCYKRACDLRSAPPRTLSQSRRRNPPPAAWHSIAAKQQTPLLRQGTLQ
ncbi:unnamed protein product, partial [Ectocarpus fasciculatus]